MRPRPENFFGPDDHTGGNVQDDIDRITEEQAEWDEEFAALPFWRRLMFGVLGS